jgi:hypothetical protein
VADMPLRRASNHASVPDSATKRLLVADVTSLARFVPDYRGVAPSGFVQARHVCRHCFVQNDVVTIRQLLTFVNTSRVN